MQCPSCGIDVTNGAEYCTGCGHLVADPSSSAQNLPNPQGFGAVAHRQAAYAGFWLRLVAYMIDSMLLGIVAGFAILRPMMERAGIAADNPPSFIEVTLPDAPLRR